MTDDTTPEEIERRVNDRRRLILAVDAAGEGKPAPAPRRSGRDRRAGERRRLTVTVSRERRKGERRVGERRTRETRREPGDRRVRGPTVFTVEEAALIVAEARRPGLVACPRCRNTLTLRPPIASESRSVWVVYCGACRCKLRIENL